MKKIRLKFGINFPTLLMVYFVIALCTGIGIGVSRYYSSKEEFATVSGEQTKATNEEITIPKKIEIKLSALLNIPFTVQAPLNNWNVHDESCEEAGILMVHYYFTNTIVPNGIIPKEIANTELITMKNWQVKNYGKEPDLDMTALGQFAKDYYGYNFKVIKSANENDVKKAISEGNPVFLPVITHGLQNSMFGRVPSYHVLLIRGYDATGVIVNDSGVGNGQAHHYSWEILWQAVDQQTAKMKQGRDLVIITK